VQLEWWCAGCLIDDRRRPGWAVPRLPGRSTGVIILSGPLSRKVLEKVTNDDVGCDAFPFVTARDIRIGYKAIDSLRIEKRSLVWGADITPDYNNPFEPGR
jgi:glycine cleavage system aminomethyltransferase T